MYRSSWSRRFYVLALLIAGGVLVVRASAVDTRGWGFSTANLDRSCKPCDDFYQFAMGGWMKDNPVPAEFPTWGSGRPQSDGDARDS